MIKNIVNGTKRNMQRSGWRAFAIIFLMIVTFFILGLQMIIMYFSRGLAQYFVGKTEVIAFFENGVSEEQIQQVKTEVGNMEFVVSVRYVSKEEALKSFIEENKDDKKITESITVNPFPAHLNVKVASLDKVNTIAQYFRGNEQVQKVFASEKVLDSLKKIVSGIQIFGFVLLGIFSITTFVIIFMTVGITVYSQKEEIIVMKLVGASDWYVRLPYLCQGMIYGFVSSFIASGLVLLFIFFKYDDFTYALLGDSNLIPLTPITLALGVCIQLIFALILSIFSSYIATRRYIKY